MIPFGWVSLVSLIFFLPADALGQLRAVSFVSGLSLPVAFAQDPSNSSVQYVAEQKGLIRVIEDGILQSTPFLDLTSLVSADGERGLLGLAFPPNYGASGRFFVFYTRNGDGSMTGDIVVARYKRSTGNTLLADPASRKDLEWGSLPYIEHTVRESQRRPLELLGRRVTCTSVVGDGGGGDDPTNNAQNPFNRCSERSFGST